MDLSKYPLEKLLHIVASVIPGFVVLVIYHAAVPNSFTGFWSMGSVGYRTRLSIVLLLALVVGSTVNAIVNSLLGGIGGAVGAYTYKHHYMVEFAPWRDPTWRAALSKVLREPPKNTLLWPDWFYEMKRKAAESAPGGPNALALTQVDSEMLQNRREDREWARWYEHYHTAVLQPRENDVVYYVQRGLQFNLQTASLYTLVSLFFVPAIRHWWCVLPASIWVALLIGSEVYGAKNVMNKWSTLDLQITHLTEVGRIAPGSQTGANI